VVFFYLPKHATLVGRPRRIATMTKAPRPVNQTLKEVRKYLVRQITSLTKMIVDENNIAASLLLSSSASALADLDQQRYFRVIAFIVLRSKSEEDSIGIVKALIRTEEIHVTQARKLIRIHQQEQRKLTRWLNELVFNFAPVQQKG
jgi:hypothetical protein